MILINLGAYRRRDIGIVLVHLQEQHERGEIKGLELVVMDKQGREQVSFSGSYKTDANAAQAGALRILRRAGENDELKPCDYY